MATKRLDILLNARDRASKTFGRVGRSFGSLARKLTSLPALLGVGLGGAGLVAFAKSSVTAFGVQEKAVANLRQSLIDAGDAGASTLPSLRAFASSFQEVTTQGDEATLALAAYIGGIGDLTGGALEEATKGTLGLARATGQGSEIMGRALLNALQGNFSMLERYIPALRTTEDETQKMALVQQLASKGLSQMTTDAGTTIGGFQQLSNTFGDMQEEIAGKLEPQLRSLSQFLLDSIPTIKQYVLDFVGGFQTVIEWAGNLKGSVVDSFKSMFELLAFGMNNWRDLMKVSLLSVAKGLVSFVEDTRHFFGTVVPTLLKFFAENWRDVLTDLFNFTATVFTNLATNIVDVISSIPDLITGSVSFSDVWKPLTDGFEATLRELPEIAKREIGALEGQLGDQIARLQAGIAKNVFEADKIKRANRAADNRGKASNSQQAKPGPTTLNLAAAAASLSKAADKLNGGGLGTGSGGASGGAGTVEALQISRRFLGLADRARQGQDIQRSLLASNKSIDDNTKAAKKALDRLNKAVERGQRRGPSSGATLGSGLTINLA